MADIEITSQDNVNTLALVLLMPMIRLRIACLIAHQTTPMILVISAELLVLAHTLKIQQLLNVFKTVQHPL
jgi:hypothetical protein